MPYCKVCKNKRLFGSSKVPPVAPTANGAVSGLMANFNDHGDIVEVTRMGAEKSVAKEATRHPQEYFDVCSKCGSGQVEW